MSPDKRCKPITATTVATYHHLQCDLFLHKSYHIDASKSESSPERTKLVKATLSRGDKWEATLFAWLNEEGLLLTVLGGLVDGQEIHEIIEFDERDRFFVSGLSFAPPAAAFKPKFRGNGHEPIAFGVAKPDLVEIIKEKDGTILWRVIDAKSSGSVKTSHHAQIYFYHICLENLLPKCFKTMGTAAVWIPPSIYGTSVPTFEGLHSITTPLLSVSMDDFLFNQLPRILSLNSEDVNWHFNPLCHGCTFEADCSQKAIKDGRLGAMANISVQDAELLRDMLAILPRKITQPGALSDIEELYRAVNFGSLNQLERTHPSTFKRAKRILKLHNNVSPVIDAARTQQIQVIKKRIFSLPCEEDIAIIISLVLDPLTNNIAAFGVTTLCADREITMPSPVFGPVSNMIVSLAQIVQYVLDLNEVRSIPPRTQCYVFSQAERTALQHFLIDSSLTADPLDDELFDNLRTCIGALCEGAALLATSFQPLVLSGTLLDFLGKADQRTLPELHACLRRLGLPSKSGDTVELRRRIQEEVDKLKATGQGVRSASASPACGGSELDRQTSERRREIGQLPRVVVLKRAVEQLLIFPVPGYWELPICHAFLTKGLAESIVCPSDEEIYSAYVDERQDEVRSLVLKRNRCMYEVLVELRRRTSVNAGGEGKMKLLVNEARMLTSHFMDICTQDHLRKLFFMQQFEVLSKLTTLWNDRIDGCAEAPRLEYRDTRRLEDNSYVHHFYLCSGYIELASDKERSYYGYILTEDEVSDSGLPTEALFDDLGVFNLVFPLNRYTRARWEKQPITVQKKVFVADIHDMVVRDFHTYVVLRTFGDFNLRLKKNARYRLSPRLVDFNVTKILSTLVEIDLQTPLFPGYMMLPPFLQLISAPISFSKLSSEMPKVSEIYIRVEERIQSSLKELHSLGNEAAGSLMLKPSQRRALKRILKNKLAVVWGPPGTGKTYTLSLSLLRLIEVKHRCKDTRRQIIFVTAMTHAAISACIKKLENLIDKYRNIPNYLLEWLDYIRLERVLSGFNHPVPGKDGLIFIYAGTVYQLHNFCKRMKVQVDCVIIDEAGQLGLGPASLVLKALRPDGRVIISGDSEQLAPIVTTQYPRVDSCLFGSILDCLMYYANKTGSDPDSTFSEIATPLSVLDSDISTIVQLTENFRLNPDLGDFVSTIYKRSFKPQKTQNTKVAKQLEKLRNVSINSSSDNANHLSMQAGEFLVSLSSAMRRRPQHFLSEPFIKSNDHHVDPNPFLDMRQISLALVRFRAISSRPTEQISYETHVRAEAAFAASLVRLLQRAAPEESIFVATPHRIQRQAVRDALITLKAAPAVDDLADELQLSSLRDNDDRDDESSTAVASDGVPVGGSVTVDTIERLQGSEASFVICLFSHTYTTNVSMAIDFLLERRRLNVAISRARTLCILVTSKEVLRPPVRVFTNPQSLKGFAFLKAYDDRAWSGTVTADLDRFSEL